jgi:hypothetical protein
MPACLTWCRSIRTPCTTAACWPTNKAGLLTPSTSCAPKRLSTPRSARHLDDEPGPATRRSGAYRDGTSTR